MLAVVEHESEIEAVAFEIDKSASCWVVWERGWIKNQKNIAEVHLK